jgi:hypothetical protein
VNYQLVVDGRRARDCVGALRVGVTVNLLMCKVEEGALYFVLATVLMVSLVSTEICHPLKKEAQIGGNLYGTALS